MLVLQAVKVLPAGARIVITDESVKQLSFKKAMHDDSLIFNTTYEYDRYYNMYSIFKCAKLTAYYIESIHDICYEIEVRG